MERVDDEPHRVGICNQRGFPVERRDLDGLDRRRARRAASAASAAPVAGSFDRHEDPRPGTRFGQLLRRRASRTP